MLSRKFVGSVCAVTLLACTFASLAVAQPLDKPIYFTFSAPVSIPGVTLPAGTYLFRIADPIMGRSVVQVLSEDGRTLYSQFFTVPAVRPEKPERAHVQFMETRGDVPHAIRSYWYPAERSGWEPIYPREQAKFLARNSGQAVLTSRATAAALIEANSLVRISADGAETVAAQ